jgi:hypothetical protein
MALSGQVFGWVAVLLFGAVTILGAVSWIRGAPRLTATVHGLTLVTVFGRKTYPWEKCGTFWVDESNRVRRVRFNIVAANDALSVSRVLSGSDVQLGSNFGLSATTLAEKLNQWRDWANGSLSASVQPPV